MTRTDLKTRLSKMIPAGVVVTLLLQALAWIWWVAAFAATTTLRLDDLDQNKMAMQQVPENIAVLKSKMESVSDQIKELRVLIINKNLKVKP